METKPHSGVPNRVYEDFEPSTEWVHEEDCDTLLLYLAGFKKEQLRAQLTTTRNLNISGERPLGNNRWRRFQKLFPISANCDTNKITAKFEDGILIVKQPKLITPAQKQQDEEKPPITSEAPKPKPTMPTVTDAPQPQLRNEKTNNGLANAKTSVNPDKAQEKDTSIIANGKRSEREKTDIGKDVSQKITTDQEKEKSDHVIKAKEGNNITRKTSEKREVPSDSLNGTAAKGSMDNEDGAAKGSMDNEDGAAKSKTTPGNSLKQAEGGLPAKLKIPNKFINLALTLLCVIVLGVYVSNSIRSYNKPEN